MLNLCLVDFIAIAAESQPPEEMVICNFNKVLANRKWEPAIDVNSGKLANQLKGPVLLRRRSNYFG
jgi:hypothetical protein